MGVRARLTAVAAVLVVTSGGSAPVSVAGESATWPPPAPSPRWHLAAVPKNEPTSNLWDVAAVDATHAWAVGFEGYHPDHQYTTGDSMILRWNGTEWSRAPLPPVQGRVIFDEVAASSATDVWVVGGPRSRSYDDIVHVVWRFDGNTWSEVPFPAGATPSELSIRDLSVVDGRAWLVGYRGNVPEVHEWTGQAWRKHEPPTECVHGGFPNFCTMHAVKAFAPDNVWAVGNGMWNGFAGPLLFHWNGSVWRPVQVGVTQQPLTLVAIDGRSPTDIWAVGDSQGQGAGNIVVHGDGAGFRVVSGPSPRNVTGVAVGAAGDPWVIGHNSAPGSVLSTYRSGAWAETPSPVPPGTMGASYNAVVSVPGTGRFIAVGTADLPNTSPRRLRAAILEYGSPPVSVATDIR